MAPGGVEQLVKLLLHDASFARSVQQRDGEAAAAAAVGLVKSHFKAFANVLRPGSSVASLPPLDSGSPTAAALAGGRRLSGPDGHHHGAGGAAGRRLSDPGALAAPHKWPELRPKDRVVINFSHKRAESDTMGKTGSVVGVLANGWVKVQVGGDLLDFQQRHLTPLPKGSAAGSSLGGAARGPGDHKITLKGASGAGGRAAGAAGAGAAGGGPAGSQGGGAGAAGGATRRVDALKALRRELVALEEEVPWREVSERWRQVRQRWCKAVRSAESTTSLAALIGELHDHLRTDKTSGTFAAGGPWEAALGACARGESNHVQLGAVWEEMKAALRAWLAAGCLPDGLEGLDKPSYDQALATYALLQEAAMRGPDALEQVPLDQILTTQRDVLALQHIIQRELAAAHGKLQAVATGSVALPAAAQQTLALPDPGGELSDALLMQLGKLPRLRSAAAAIAAAAGGGGGAAGADVDTDLDTGSDATDVGELDLMDTH